MATPVPQNVYQEIANKLRHLTRPDGLQLVSAGQDARSVSRNLNDPACGDWGWLTPACFCGRPSFSMPEAEIRFPFRFARSGAI
jgi:hypothetical protein